MELIVLEQVLVNTLRNIRVNLSAVTIDSVVEVTDHNHNIIICFLKHWGNLIFALALSWLDNLLYRFGKIIVTLVDTFRLTVKVAGNQAQISLADR